MGLHGEGQCVIKTGITRGIPGIIHESNDSVFRRPLVTPYIRTHFEGRLLRGFEKEGFYRTFKEGELCWFMPLLMNSTVFPDSLIFAGLKILSFEIMNRWGGPASVQPASISSAAYDEALLISQVYLSLCRDGKSQEE